MTKDTHQTLGASVPVTKAKLYEAYIKASGLTKSQFILAAMDAYIATLPVPTGAPVVPVRPPMHPLPTARDVFLDPHVQPIWARMGITVTPSGEYANLSYTETGQNLDSEAHSNAQLEIRWACGQPVGASSPDFFPTRRHPGDTQLLDWLEYLCYQKDSNLKHPRKLLARVVALRAHLTTIQ